MPKLRNEAGVVVSVSDKTAALLGSGWTDAEAPAKRKPGRPKKSESVDTDATGSDNE